MPARPACCSGRTSGQVSTSQPAAVAAACSHGRSGSPALAARPRHAPLHHRRAAPPPTRTPRGPPPVAAVKKTFTSFDDMIAQSSVPVLIDFHATWCGPCRLMSESVAAAAKELGPDTVTVVKIDTDAYPALASRFRVSALPTLVLFRGGSPVDRVEGYLAPGALADRVRYYCKGLDAKFGRR